MNRQLTETPVSRRNYLHAAGLVGLAAVVPLAGCTNDPDPDPNPMPTVPAFPGQLKYGSWFDGVGNYTGTTGDYRSKKRVLVTVGAPGPNGHYAFEPAAVAVVPGTTVTWRWTGKGGSHDVVADDGSFESPYVGDAGATFSHTFETPGVYKYYCSPHKSMGMRGAVAVVDLSDDGQSDDGGDADDAGTGDGNGVDHAAHGA